MTAAQQGETPSSSYFGTFFNPEAVARAINGTNAWSGGPHPVGQASKDFHATLEFAVLGRLSVSVARLGEAISQSAVTANMHTFMFATEPGTIRRISGRNLFG